jgi:hypothetical protein
MLPVGLPEAHKRTDMEGAWPGNSQAARSFAPLNAVRLRFPAHPSFVLFGCALPSLLREHCFPAGSQNRCVQDGWAEFGEPCHTSPPTQFGDAHTHTKAGGGGGCPVERFWNSPVEETRRAGLRKRILQVK